MRGRCVFVMKKFLVLCCLLLGLASPALAQTTLTGVYLTGGNDFPKSAPPSTVVGAVSVSTTGGPFTGTLSITGANSGGFALSSSTLPSNLICSSTCPSTGWPFTDFNVVATQGGASGSPFSFTPAVVGIIVSQVHNAPGWQTSHSYTYASGPYTRVVNGAGWTPATASYTSGQPLNAYQLTSTGSCTSASSGGPSGTGSSITDGSCTWKYLSTVDYISLTGWAFDNQAWAAGTIQPLTVVNSDTPRRAYILQGYRGSSYAPCTSTVAPTGTSPSTGDGCSWVYIADVTYTSGVSHIPTQTWTGVYGIFQVNMAGNYEAQLWNDRTYTAGSNGESGPLRTSYHVDYEGEGTSFTGCPTSGCYRIIITTAPGEGFSSNLSNSVPLAGVDPTKGVTLYSTLNSTYPIIAGGFTMVDNLTDLIGLQIQSTVSDGVSGYTSYSNGSSVQNSIVDGGYNLAFSSFATIALDTSAVISNSLIISHTQVGINLKYPGSVVWDTIVSSGVLGSIGVATEYNWPAAFANPTAVVDSAIFGFSHAGAVEQSPYTFATYSANNITDAPIGDSGTGNGFGGTGNYTVATIPGTTYGAVESAAVFSAGGGWRTKTSGPLINGGAAYGPFNAACTTSGPCVLNMKVDSPDIFGLARPQSGQYDIGAVQTSGAPPPPTVLRLHLGPGHTW